MLGMSAHSWEQNCKAEYIGLYLGDSFCDKITLRQDLENLTVTKIVSSQIEVNNLKNEKYICDLHKYIFMLG